MEGTCRRPLKSIHQVPYKPFGNLAKKKKKNWSKSLQPYSFIVIAYCTAEDHNVKYFQNCMCDFREKWVINLTTWHTLPCFKPPWLLTISAKSKVTFRCWSGITCPTVNRDTYKNFSGSLHKALAIWPKIVDF